MSYDENEGLDGPRAQAPERRILLGHGSYGGPINGRILGLFGLLGGFQGLEEISPVSREYYDKVLNLRPSPFPITKVLIESDIYAIQQAEEKRRRKAQRKAASTRPKAESLVTTGGSTHE